MESTTQASTREPGPRDPARLIAVVTALFSIGVAFVHLSAAADHANLPVMMTGFIVVALLQAGLGALLLWRRPSQPVLLAAITLMLGSVGLWLLSRTVGLPFLPGGHMEPIGFKDGIAVLLELAAVPGLLLLMSRDLVAAPLLPPRLAPRILGTAGAGTFVLLIPALLLDGGAHHSHEEAVAMGIHDHAHGDEGHVADGQAAAASSTSGHDHEGALASDGTGDGHDHAPGSGHPEARSLDGRDVGHSTVGHGGGSSHESGGGGRDHGGGSDHPTAAHADGRGTDHATQGHRDGVQHDTRRHDAGTGSEDDPHGHRDTGGSGEHGRDEHASPDHDDDGGEDGHDGGDHDEGHGDGGTDDPEGDDPPARPFSVTYEPAEPGENGEPGKGSAIRVGDGSDDDGHGHHAAGEPCEPTSEQMAAATELQRDTAAALRKYDNNPALAIADGYHVAFNGARFIHLFNMQHVYDTPSYPPLPSAMAPDNGDPVILDPNRIEAFMYAPTDDGLIAIGGMYMMPAEYDEVEGDLLKPRPPFKGPEIGGCLTRWHDHPDLGMMVNRSGAPTPEMLHVWTYPGLDPYREYSERELTWMFTPTSYVPTTPGPLKLVDALRRQFETFSQTVLARR